MSGMLPLPLVPEQPLKEPLAPPGLTLLPWAPRLLILKRWGCGEAPPDVDYGNDYTKFSWWGVASLIY